MIDANENLTAPVSRSTRRSAASKVTSSKRGGLTKSKKGSGSRVERVFSDAKCSPYIFSRIYVFEEKGSGQHRKRYSYINFNVFFNYSYCRLSFPKVL